MSWHFSLALVAAFSAATCSDGEPCAPLKLNPTPQAFCSQSRMRKFSRLSPSGMTFAPLTDELGEAMLTWFLAASPAKTSPQRAKELALRARNQDFGGKCTVSFARFDQPTLSWKIAHALPLEGWDGFSETWPRAGTMRNGWCWERTTSELPTSASACGFSLSTQPREWPTPTVSGNNNRKGSSPKAGDGLATAVRKAMWPTPTCHDADKVCPAHYRRKSITLSACVGTAENGGPLNPEWVEWLMGWPIGWTALKPSGTDKFLSWLQQHSDCSTTV